MASDEDVDFCDVKFLECRYSDAVDSSYSEHRCNKKLIKTKYPGHKDIFLCFWKLDITKFCYKKNVVVPRHLL